MPIRKIADIPRVKKCRDPDHEIPNMICLEPGIYEHECPSCGKKTTFVVDRGGRLSVTSRDGHGPSDKSIGSDAIDPRWNDSRWWRAEREPCGRMRSEP